MKPINPAIAILHVLTGNFYEYFKRGKTPSSTKKGPGRKHKQGYQKDKV